MQSPQIIKTMRNVSFGNTPKYHDLEPPCSLISLVTDVLRARVRTRSFAQSACAMPECELCAESLREAEHAQLEAGDAIWNWYRYQGRRWNRYQVGEFFVYCTKGDDQGRFFSVVCDRQGRIPCCGCGSYGQRVEFDLTAVPFIPDRRIVKTCPICEGRGNILASPEIALLAEKEVALVH